MKPVEKRSDKSLATPEALIETGPLEEIKLATFESNLIAPTLLVLVVLPEILIKPVPAEILPAKLINPFQVPVPIAVIEIVPAPEV